MSTEQTAAFTFDLRRRSPQVVDVLLTHASVHVSVQNVYNTTGVEPFNTNGINGKSIASHVITVIPLTVMTAVTWNFSTSRKQQVEEAGDTGSDGWEKVSAEDIAPSTLSRNLQEQCDVF